jgi:flagellar motor switch protein FliN/FliY
MSAAPDSIRRPDAASFVQLWAEALAHVLSQITSAEVPCVALTEAPRELPPAGDSDQWIVCTCKGALRGELNLRLNPAVVLGFAQVFMSEPAAPEVALSADHREAVVELFRQVAGTLATSLKPIWGEVQLLLEAAAGATSWSASSTFWLRAHTEKSADALVELNMSAALDASLATAARPDTSSGSAHATVPSATASPAPAAASLTAAQSENKLELLMEVELAMTLRFGARRLLLREVLDLCPGAVVELDRQMKDPVELLLDGRLVALGEVVVIDGNYGLRVTEVISAGAPEVSPWQR